MNYIKKNISGLVGLLFILTANGLLGADRFPRPEFDNQHVIPTPTVPQPSMDIYHLIDLGVLVAARCTRTGTRTRAGEDARRPCARYEEKANHYLLWVFVGQSGGCS